MPHTSGCISCGIAVLRVVFLTASLAVAGCTAVPFDPDLPVERALPADDTRLARDTARLFRGQGMDKVRVAPLVDGNDALGARLRMIEAAERSIDVKTFLIKPDMAGGLMWLALLEAADRGVRVRLLYDDVFTSARDDQIASLDAHPNVDIRAFNPLSRNSTTAMNFVLDFARVNRRMHNKAMIVDGSLAVIGGRNIADEYYQIETDSEFADFDLLVIGAPVKDLSAAFDLYWNDAWSVPMARLADGDIAPLREAQVLFRSAAASEAAEIYDRAVNSTYLRDLLDGRVETFAGSARVVVDDPEKLRTPPGQGPFVVGDSFYNTLMRAQSEVLIITPYFVPEPYGAEVFEALVARGVHVRVTTNALSATNHAYVHGGYAPYRDRLIKAGVEFLEVRPDGPSLVAGVETPLVLHTKLAIVDDQTLFVGSANIDPRSIRQNTEVGMVIESATFAQRFLEFFDPVIEDYAFAVQADANGNPVWQYRGEAVSGSEPGASAWRKITATIAGWLPVEWQL
ncbi:phospholipase D family protein [Tropicimonas sp. S265A]|uniref:phospholipase D family protein n=1 Tax=Tropicimonas sp. S265A TaxID=3415134 RepID=UPI003C7BEEBA